jgi:hypothetical protein
MHMHMHSPGVIACLSFCVLSRGWGNVWPSYDLMLGFVYCLFWCSARLCEFSLLLMVDWRS